MNLPPIALLASLIVVLPGCDTGRGPSPSGVLDVLTYNVHGLPAPIAQDDPAGRMPQISPLLSPYDIVGIQEAWVDDYYEALLAGTDHETAVRFDLKLNDDRFYGSGLAVLADLPEVSHHHQHYTTCNGTLDSASDCLASKGFQRVRLRLATQGEEHLEVDVWNTHFEAGGGDADVEARAAHVDDLVAAMLGQSAGRAMIFTADQNLSPWDDPEDVEPYARLTDEVGLADSCDLLTCDDPEHIDKVMIRSGDELLLEAEAWADEADFFDAEGDALSDHPAISARLTWSVLLPDAPN